MQFVHGSVVLFEKAKLTNHNTNKLEIMHVNRFSSELVHRHIVNPFMFL